MKRLSSILFSHDVALMPPEMKQRKNVILTTSIVSTIIFDIFTFFVKGSQAALAAGMNWLSLILIILYFMTHVLRNSVQTFVDTQKTKFSEQSDSYITANVSEISNVFRGKGFRKKGKTE